MKLTLFLDPWILTRVGRPLLLKLFDCFIGVDLGWMPSRRPGNDCFFDGLARVLEDREDIPKMVLQALGEIEFNAKEDHGPYERLDDGTDPDSDSARLRRAIESWLARGVQRMPVSQSQGSPDTQRGEPLSPAVPETPAPVSMVEGATAAAEPPEQASSAENAEGAVPDFTRLAGLSPLEYERMRKAEAKRLNLRLGTLDAEVEGARPLEYDTQANAILLPKVEPWPEPITDAPALFDEVLARFARHLHAPPGAHEVFTLWKGHAHALGAFALTPRLYVSSDEPGCGKSTAINLLASMAPKALRTQNMSPAVLFRVVDQHQPTVFLDELETYLPLYKELRGLLNAGIQVGACVYRCEGQTARAFKAFAPTVFAGLGELPATLRDRSIRFHLEKAPPGVELARFDLRDTQTEAVLNRKLARWAADKLGAIAGCEPVLPAGAHNRLADLWRPLFAVAQTVGGAWPERAAEAYESIASRKHNRMVHPAGGGAEVKDLCAPGKGVKANGTTMKHQLLGDVRKVFTESGMTRMFTRDLVAALCTLPGREWQRLVESHLRPELWLAEELRACGIRPRTLRVDGMIAKGYVESDFVGGAREEVDGTNGDAGFDPGI